MFMKASSGTLVIVLDLEVVKGHSEPQMANPVIVFANGKNKVWPNKSGPDFFHKLLAVLKEFEKQNILENENTDEIRSSTFSK